MEQKFVFSPNSSSLSSQILIQIKFHILFIQIDLIILFPLFIVQIPFWHALRFTLNQNETSHNKISTGCRLV